MFEHEYFDKYDLNLIPLNQDTYLVDEIYAADWEKAFLKVFRGESYQSVGYVSNVAVNQIHSNTLEMSWYPNISVRFHEFPIILPKSEIRSCIGCWRYDWNPTIFVSSSWLSALYDKTFSAFCMVDAAGVKNALRQDEITRSKLVSLRQKVDDLAKENPDVAIVSFADSLLIKVNWTVGSVHNHLTYTYAPERLLNIAKKLCQIVQNSLELSAYAIFSQGYNEFFDDKLIHISDSANHISLNSLGIPFANILAIDDTARRAIKSGAHEPAEVYMDSNFYHSVRFTVTYDKNKRPKASYVSPMSAKSEAYFYSDFETVLSNLEC